MNIKFEGTVIKRSGQKVHFDRERLVNAITKANGDVSEDLRMTKTQIDRIVDQITINCMDLDHIVSVEELQDMVEDKIMQHGAFEVARAYIKYRYNRELSRKANTTDDKILSLIDRTNEEAKAENANKNPVVNSTQRDYMAGEVSRDLTERILLPKDIVEAHKNGIIHFHDSDYYAQREHNCFAGSTRFITNRGICRFNEFKDGDSVTVKDKDGCLRKATVRNYGKGTLNKITLKAGRRETSVLATSNHRWILSDGSVTTNIGVGDALYGLKKSTEIDWDNLNNEEIEAFTLGFVVGDGTDHYSHTKVRLCGDKIKYLNLFLLVGYHVTGRPDNNDVILSRKKAIKQDFINGKGWRYLSAHLQALVFKGYYAADGASFANKISTSDERLKLLIEETSGLAGYFISSFAEEKRDTNYKKDAILYSYHFVIKQPDNLLWKVSKIERSFRSDAALWCVEEPITHSFTLENGIVTGNCDLIDLEDMLQNGTVITETLIEKPHSFYTACNVTTQIIAQVASNQFGGQSFSFSHLAPFIDVSRQRIMKEVTTDLQDSIESGAISKEKISEIVEKRLLKEIKSGVQTIQYQLLTLMTTNGQTPFVTAFMYLNEVPEGRLRDDLNILIKEVLKQRMEGVKNKQGVWITPAFPKLIYVLDENNISEGTEYWETTVLAAKCTAKRLVPDYISAKVMKELKNGNTFTAMGCRSFLTVENSQLNPDGSHKFYGRFNQGVVTINLVDVACSSYGNMDKFWEILDERLELCHRALRLRHERLLGTPSDVAPILWQHGAIARLKEGELIDKLLYNGYSTISLGYAGLCEMCYYMIGETHTSKAGEEFALKVMQRLNDKCAEWKAAENIAYSVYGTPLESTTYKFAKSLKKRFGVIPHVTDKNYITNSYHVHVTEEIDAFSKLKFEAKFQKLSPGGAISYVEIPNMQHNIEAVLDVMKYIYENIMYAELNTKSDYCQVCGYEGEISIVDGPDGKPIWECPNCGNHNHDKMNTARRVCGYIGNNDFNAGRMEEVKERVLHL